MTLVGGHSIDDKELKYGLSVTGIVHPNRLVTNEGAEAGDKIILTKPLGTGIIGTALKAGVADKETVEKFTKCMVTLNNRASELMQEVGVHACTDITGFGLLGHACQVAEHSQAGIKISLASVPYFPEVIEFARKGLCPGGLFRNREFYSNRVEFAAEVPEDMQRILFDAQTSGGLLIFLAPEAAKLLLDRLHEVDVQDAAIIGEVVSKPAGKVLVE